MQFSFWTTNIDNGRSTF